ncbi:MAG: PIN domain-containing protein, partial [archaeon]
PPRRRVRGLQQVLQRERGDIKDAMYLALALKLNCPIWSNDKLLKNQTQIKVYSTSELMTKFSSK